MKFSVKEITLIGITAAMMVAIGYVLYVAGSFLPIPGSKFIMFSPFLGFILTMPIYKIKKIGVLSAISFVFGMIMSGISIFMGLAILASGIFSDLLSKILFKNYNSTNKIMLSVGLYPMCSLINSFLVGVYITGNKAFALDGGYEMLLIISLIIYGLGVFGSYVALKLLPSRVFSQKC
ncbi:hypothetical protein [Inediibacterium massiliense]|uniref:hypothetical protein n=1 Tax=Inediibacterium massiliense TaxID=1658111 RepID=UPI0006B427E8|nr:hypothetical protein [Inediibacterium massiliense]